MNPIDQTFARLKREGKPAFIPYVTVGDPDISTSLDILKELQTAGASVIELGVPFSDPLADGPVIQRAALRALKNDVSISDVISLAKLARQEQIHTPLVLFTYFNPLLQLGIENAFSMMEDSGINGIIVPDLPVEEGGEIRHICTQKNIHYIPLVAPTSEGRIESIVNHASGFVYCVSSLGVTGERQNFHNDIEGFLATVKKATALPLVVGFGVSNAKQFKKLSSHCDGVVVGSAIVHTIEKSLPLLQHSNTYTDGLLRIRGFVDDLIPV
ncbi:MULTISPECIES: tryptophan synthase subunit alpha [Bacillus]|uniref:tryptophan synthase subunit alpha n=1 Tax=Bacillus TaxID=1386 RepID=UPI001B08F057|nr:tryptophan synthase subunit alpha [Bacillus sonorensis]GIN66495.1 tryptophan synthase alpha chain [Bacillus sonorensis]